VADVVILGGPNGAGKTTAAQVVLPRRLDIREFVNADEIARGLSPFNATGTAVTAGRLMIERMRILVRDRESFAFETTCSGRAHISLLRRCKTAGWRITLVFLWLPSPQAASTAWRAGSDPADMTSRTMLWSGGTGPDWPTCATSIYQWQT
jgi:predicted ABC-type ATPase